MPRGAKGEQRPADVIRSAVKIVRAGPPDAVMDWAQIIAVMDTDAPAPRRGPYKTARRI